LSLGESIEVFKQFFSKIRTVGKREQLDNSGFFRPDAPDEIFERI